MGVMSNYPQGWWTERVLRADVKIEKLLFGRGYRVVNEVYYEMLISHGLNVLRSRIEVDRELPVRVKTLEEAKDLKARREKYGLDAK